MCIRSALLLNNMPYPCHIRATTIAIHASSIIAACISWDPNVHIRIATCSRAHGDRIGAEISGRVCGGNSGWVRRSRGGRLCTNVVVCLSFGRGRMGCTWLAAFRGALSATEKGRRCVVPCFGESSVVEYALGFLQTLRIGKWNRRTSAFDISLGPRLRLKLAQNVHVQKWEPARRIVEYAQN